MAHRNRWFTWVYLLKLVIFHGDVSHNQSVCSRNRWYHVISQNSWNMMKTWWKHVSSQSLISTHSESVVQMTIFVTKKIHTFLVVRSLFCGLNPHVCCFSRHFCCFPWWNFIGEFIGACPPAWGFHRRCGPCGPVGRSCLDARECFLSWLHLITMELYGLHHRN